MSKVRETRAFDSIPWACQKFLNKNRKEFKAFVNQEDLIYTEVEGISDCLSEKKTGGEWREIREGGSFKPVSI